MSPGLFGADGYPQTRRGAQRRSKSDGSSPDGPPALHPSLRAPIAILALLASLVFTLLAVHYAGEATPGRLDTWAQTAVEGQLPEPGLGALLIDFAGEPLGAAVLVALLAAVCLATGRQRLAVVAVVGLGVTGVLAIWLKPAIGRTIHGGFLAYPSGHTATATVFALVVMLLLVGLLGARRLPGILLILSGAVAAAATMAYSQVALGAHYLTDTVGGFCLAMLVVPVTAYLIDRFAVRLGKSGSP